MLESYTLDVFLDGHRWLYDEVRARASASLTPAPVRPGGRVARDLDELRRHSTVYDDLHVEARRVLDRNPEPRNLRDVAVALESMGYTTTGAGALGFDSVFDLATAVYDLTYLYYVPQDRRGPRTPEHLAAVRRRLPGRLVVRRPLDHVGGGAVRRPGGPVVVARRHTPGGGHGLPGLLPRRGAGRGHAPR